MRIGVYLHQRIAADGGAFTFQGSLLEGLKASSRGHELFVLHDEAVDPPRLAELGLHPIALGRQVSASGAMAELPAPASLLRRAARKARRIFGASIVSPVAASPSPEMAKPAIRTAVERLGLDLVWYPDPASDCIDFGTPFFVTVWDLEHRKQPFFPEVSVSGWTWEARERHYARVLPRAAAIFTGTAEGRDEIIRFFRVDPQRVIVNPFAAPRIIRAPHRTATASGLTQPYLLYPAQFWPHKNHVNLLHALQRLRQHHGCEVDLVLTGSDMGNRQHIQATAIRLGLQESVHFAGFVSSEELQALYASAQALVFPSLFGPDNLPPLEAFSLGCPVVAAAIPGAAQHLEDAALLFDPLDPDDIALKIVEVLREPQTRARLIERGRAVVASRTPERYVATVLAAADRFSMLRHNWGTEFRHA